MLKANIGSFSLLALAACSVDTKYTDGFNQEGFEQIKVGTPVDEVKRLIGEPAEVFVVWTAEYWRYDSPAFDIVVDWPQTADGSMLLSPQPSDFTYAHEATLNLYDPKLKPKDIPKTPRRIVAKFGPPSLRRKTEQIERWSYAFSPSHTSHARRDVCVDTVSNKAIEIDTSFYWD